VHALLHAAQSPARRRIRSDTAAIIADHHLHAMLRLVQRDRDLCGIGMTQRVGETFLDTAIEREIDRVAIAWAQAAGHKRDLCLRLLAGALGDQLRDEIAERHVAERHRAQTIQHAAIDRLQVIDDRQHVARAILHVAGGRIGAKGRDRGRVGLEPKETWADLVVQFERGAPPLIVLRRDHAAIERVVLRAQRIERLRQRIEAIRDGAKLRRAGARETDAVVAPLEIAQAMRQSGQRPEHVAEQRIEQDNDREVDRKTRGAKRQRVLPDFRDLIASLAGDQDRTGALALRDDRQFAPLCRRRDERREPGRRRAIGIRRSSRRSHHQRQVSGVAHRNAHVAHETAAQRNGFRERRRGRLLLRDADGLGNQRLCQIHRRGDLDPRRRARPHDHDAAGDRRGDQVDQDEDDQKLCTQREPAPRRKTRTRKPQGCARRSDIANGGSRGDIGDAHGARLGGGRVDAQPSPSRRKLDEGAVENYPYAT
jgi:hypothetical protein